MNTKNSVLIISENCYCSLDSMFSLFFIILKTKNQACSLCFQKQKTVFKNRKQRVYLIPNFGNYY